MHQNCRYFASKSSLNCGIWWTSSLFKPRCAKIVNRASCICVWINLIAWRVSMYNTMTSQWASWRLNSPAIRRFIQPSVEAKIKEPINCALPTLYEEIPSVTAGFPSQKASNSEAFPWHAVNIILFSKSLKTNMCQTDIEAFHTPFATYCTSNGRIFRTHDDLIKCKHFPPYWPFVRGIHRSPVNSPHRDQWRGALVFSLICA